MLRENGVLICMELESGKVHYRKRLGGKSFRSSVIIGDDKVYCLGKEGLCTVVQPGEEGNILATNQLTGEFFATPAISDGVIYLRGFHQLYAIGRTQVAAKP